MVEESNKYGLKIDITKPLNLSKAELEQFIGIIFLMSIVKMPSTRDYWEQSLQYKTISKVMPIRRFKRIKRFLHCNDNTQMPRDGNDKLCKIRPIINTLKSHFQFSVPTENLCIDEQMVPFKGRSQLKEYNPQKPIKWGYKLYVLTSPEGQIYNFEVHTGAIEKCPRQLDLQASGNSYAFIIMYSTK